METGLQQLLRELEQFGEGNDATISDRPRRMLNITRSTGELLGVLVRSAKARQVLEIGTSNGYSTLWLAEACSATGGQVHTVEFSEFKCQLARSNFERSGLGQQIILLQEDAGHVLAETEDDAYDLIFLDSERSEYLGWWPELRRILRPGGLLVVDNAVSHEAEMVGFMAQVKADPAFFCCVVPVGNGEFMATRAVREDAPVAPE
ncbi:O-methyltransferase [Rhodobacteraceae bacterium CH30]|nr:O-methyltransferase [Rhodobacteraceae bacterium CH30]